jgi:hypothetical protein
VIYFPGFGFASLIQINRIPIIYNLNKLYMWLSLPEGGVVTLFEAGGNDVRQNISDKGASDGFPLCHCVKAMQVNLECRAACGG